jgi:outer membrane protein assembly factor BamD (BamD/ComL family)
MAVASAGCTVKLKIFRKPDFSKALRVENIADEIARLETAVAAEKDPTARSKSLFHLALLYSHHQNPSPDYRRALKRLEEYAALNPAEANTDEALYLRSLLQRIENGTLAYEKLQREEVGTRQDRIEALQQENEGLARENQEMKQAIEKLKLLDIRLEKKRRNH